MTKSKTWEYTVLTVEQINQLPVNKLSGLPTPVAVAKAQAKITGDIAYEAGREAERKFILQNTDCLKRYCNAKKQN